MWKNGLPHITDRFTNKTQRHIIAWGLEGQEPWNTLIWIWNGYKLNIHGQVIWQKDVPLKPIFKKWIRSPYFVISLKRKCAKGNITPKAKEERIDKLMERHFWPNIEWYSEMKANQDKAYIVVPKDDNWNDMSLGNLKYVIKKEYNINWTTKEILMQLIPFFKNKSDEDIAKLLSISTWWVNKVRTELKKQGKIWNKILNNVIISRSTYDIHLAVLECKWLKSNLEIAKELRPDADFEDKEEQGRLTDKVSRVRKKLYDKWLIEKYNTYQKEVSIEGVREALKLTLIANRTAEKSERKTHAEIAKVFGLTKEQVDNFSRKIK